MEVQEQDERGGVSSASSAEKDHFCPGNRNLLASIPVAQLPKDDNAVAAAGDRIHKSWENADATDLEETEADITAALVDIENKVVAQWWSEIQTRASLSISGGPGPKQPEVVRETRFWIHDIDLEPVSSAKVDVAYISGANAIVIDGKTGYLDVTVAQRNFQMKVQAVAISLERGVTRVRVVIAHHRFRSVISQADYDADALDRAYAEVLQDAWRTRQPDAPRVPGTWCQYCKAKAWCRENASYAGLPLVVATNAMPAIMPKDQMLEAIAQLQPAELVFLWKRASIIEKMLDAVKSRLKSLSENELADLGLKLEQGRRQSEIKDAGALIDYLEFNGLLGEKEVLPLFDMIFGRVEAIAIPRMIKAAEKEGKKLTKKDASKQLRDLCQSKGWIDFEASRTAGSIKEIDA